MDIFTASNVAIAATAIGSTSLLGFSIARFRKAGTVLGDALFQAKLDLSSTLSDRLFKVEREKRELDVELAMLKVLTHNQHQAVTEAGAMLESQHEIIDTQNEILNEIEETLRRIYPELPDDADLNEAIQTIFDSIVASGYAATYGGEENEKGVIARVIERLAEEVEERNKSVDYLLGELDDTRMKHGHAVEVIRTQSNIVAELRDDVRNLETELSAIKQAANDDSADADRYCDTLQRADALLSFLGAGAIEVPADLAQAFAEFLARDEARTNASRGPGAELKQAA